MNAETEREVRSWLEVALVEENLKSFEFQITEKTEKGSGFVGDVFFVLVTGTDKHGAKKEYNLALKCDKSSAALKEAYNFDEVFIREINIYKTIFPSFQQFQLEKGIKNPFDSYSKCYGVCNGPRFVIVMDNLKKLGYDLYNIKKPLTRKHLDLVMREYAKFHAISVAMKEQQPDKFKMLTRDFLTDPLTMFFNEDGFLPAVRKVIHELCDLLKNDLVEQTLNKWLNFKDKMSSIINEVALDDNILKVVIHGDSWSNNFMYKYEDEEKFIVSKVAILDWQVARLSSPILDLSYFLFACISEEDIEEIKIILKEYHNVFCDYSTEMGSTIAKSYSFERFYYEWKKYARFGVVMCLLPIKLSYTAKEDIPDMAESANKGEDIGASFNFSIKNTDGYKERMKPIIKYVVEEGLI